MSLTLTYQSYVTAAEVLSVNVPAVSQASKKTITHDGFNTVQTLNADSDPPVSQVANFEQTLTGGTDSVDLTALTGTNGAAVDATGLRVQALKLKNKAANSGSVTVAIGASNGYDGFGANFSVAVAPGGEVTLFSNDGGSDIGSANKTLDLAGTLDDEIEISIVMG